MRVICEFWKFFFSIQPCGSVIFRSNLAPKFFFLQIFSIFWVEYLLVKGVVFDRNYVAIPVEWMAMKCEFLSEMCCVVWKFSQIRCEWRRFRGQPFSFSFVSFKCYLQISCWSLGATLIAGMKNQNANEWIQNRRRKGILGLRTNDMASGGISDGASAAAAPQPVCTCGEKRGQTLGDDQGKK